MPLANTPLTPSAPAPAVATLRWALLALARWRWAGLGVAWGIAVVGTVASFVLPQRFEASARIYVDTETVLKPMMVGLTYQPDIEQQVRMLARTLISRPNMEQLVDQPEVGPRFGGPPGREKAIARLMERIKMVAADRSNLFTISYRDTDRERALSVVQGTVSLFVDSGAEEKKHSSLEAVRFIDEQIRANELKLVEAEGRLKDFKVRNFGVTGISNQDYFVRMSALTDEVNKLGNELSAAEHSRDAYRRELSAEDPQLPLESLPGAMAAPPPEIDGRLEAQRRELDNLRRRFTDEHPDVVNARRLVAQLEAQQRAEAVAKAAERQRSPQGTAATSPVYQRIRVLLAESEARVASLQSLLSVQAARLAQVRALAGRLPQVEAELAQVSRDYDVLRKNHDQLLARRESAWLGVRLDDSKQLADFRVIEPPHVLPAPVFPGRKHLALASVLAALLGGIAAALALDRLKPTFDHGPALEQATGRPVIGRIAWARTDESRRREKTDRLRFAGAAALLLLCQAASLAWIAFLPVRA
jgi:polysaccharide chain length determinant protein (PEP-CTERM system associated)